MAAKTKRSRRCVSPRPKTSDPRCFEPDAIRVGLVSRLEANANRAERDPAWKAKSDPNEWDAAVDNWIFSVAR